MDFPHARRQFQEKATPLSRMRETGCHPAGPLRRLDMQRFVGWPRAERTRGSGVFMNPSPTLAGLRQSLLPAEDRASPERGRCGRLRRHEGIERRAARGPLQVARLGVATLDRLDFLLAPELGPPHG